MKKAVFYVFYLFIFLIVLVSADIIANELRLTVMREFRLSALYIFVSFFYPIVLGMLLALPEFINKLQSRGKITIDWTKVLIIAFPTLCLHMWRTFSFVVPIPINIPYIHLILNSTLIGVILGYTLLAVISKENIDSDGVIKTG